MFFSGILLSGCFFFFSSRRRHTRCALVTGVQTCALPIFNHGISPALIDEAFDETARFHALPEEEKLKIRQGEHYVGYVPPGGIRINTGDGFDNAKNKADLQSALHVGRDFAPDHPLVQAGVRYYVPQPWPENLPGFKEKVKEYFRAVETLGRSEEHTS